MNINHVGLNEMENNQNIQQFSETEKHPDFQVTSCHHFDTANPNFPKSRPNTCEFLGRRNILKKIIGRA
jgi:hypothetical protein